MRNSELDQLSEKTVQGVLSVPDTSEMTRPKFRTPRTWGVTRQAQLGVSALVVLFPVGPYLLGVLSGSFGLWPSLTMLPFVLVLLTFVFRCLSSTVTLEAEEIIVRGVFTTRRAERSRVLGAAPGYDGVLVRVEGGSFLRVWAVQKSNLSTWPKRQTRADDVVRAIQDWAGVAPGTT